MITIVLVISFFLLASIPDPQSKVLAAGLFVGDYMFFHTEAYAYILIVVLVLAALWVLASIFG